MYPGLRGGRDGNRYCFFFFYVVRTRYYKLYREQIEERIFLFGREVDLFLSCFWSCRHQLENAGGAEQRELLGVAPLGGGM